MEKERKKEKKQTGNEEYMRRMMVAQTRGAGNKIRIEALKRQRLNVDVNIDYAKSLQETINNDFEAVSQPFKEVFQEFETGVKRQKTAQEILQKCVIAGIAIGLPTLISYPPSLVRTHVEEVNRFTDGVINNIIRDLAKEGMYLPQLNMVNPEAWPPIALILAKDTMDRSVGLLTGIIKATNKKK